MRKIGEQWNVKKRKGKNTKCEKVHTSQGSGGIQTDRSIDKNMETCR